MASLSLDLIITAQFDVVLIGSATSLTPTLLNHVIHELDENWMQCVTSIMANLFGPAIQCFLFLFHDLRFVDQITCCC